MSQYKKKIIVERLTHKFTAVGRNYCIVGIIRAARFSFYNYEMNVEISPDCNKRDWTGDNIVNYCQLSTAKKKKKVIESWKNIRYIFSLRSGLK